MNADELMEKLTRAVTYHYRDDTTSPGITVSALKKGYYASVVRYTDSFGKGKKAVCNVKADSITEALRDLAGKFLQVSAIQRDPVQELGDLVGKK